MKFAEIDDVLAEIENKIEAAVMQAESARDELQAQIHELNTQLDDLEEAGTLVDSLRAEMPEDEDEEDEAPALQAVA